MAFALRADDPRAALRWLPVHARGMADFADQRLQQGRLSPDDISRITRLATQAVKREPTARSGWRVLATIAAAQGRRDDEERLYTIANRLSRRDPLVQTWFFNRLLAAGNYQEALRHADIAMTVSPNVRRALLPGFRILTTDDTVLRRLADLLASGRPWAQAYFFDLAYAPPPPADLLRLLSVLPAEIVRPHHDLLAGLVPRYAEEDPENALRLYKYIRSDETGQVRNGSFARANRIMPFEWQLTERGPVLAEQVSQNGRPDRAALLVTGRSGFGPAARQRLVLSPGRHRWSATIGRSGRNNGSLILRICCGTDTQEAPVLDARIEPRSEAGENAAADFLVPEGRCGSEPQWLEIGVDKTGSSIWIDDLVIARAAG